MPEIPAPPYQELYSGYRYAGDATPKTAAMDYHGRPMEPVISSCLQDGEVEMTVSNTGLRVSQIVPQVPEQASYSTQRKRDTGRKVPKKFPKNERMQQIEIQRFAWFSSQMRVGVLTKIICAQCWTAHILYRNSHLWISFWKLLV